MNHHSWTALKNNTFTPEQIERMDNYTMTHKEHLIQELKDQNLINFGFDFDESTMIVESPVNGMKDLEIKFNSDGSFLL
jgi:hypothetical protein